MPYIYLLLTLSGAIMQTLFATFYNRRNTAYRSVTPLYNVINFTSLAILWGGMWLTNPVFHLGTFFYSIAFGVGFTFACVGLINALNTGPVALTSLILNFSLIATTVYGFFFWGTPVTKLAITGLVLASVALFLCLYSGKEKGNKTSGKWFVWVLVCFSGNLLCTIVQKEQQLAYGGAHGNELMFFGMIIALLVSIPLYLCSDRSDSRVLLKRAWFWPVLAGVSNLVMNFFLMRLANSSLSANIVYPSIAVIPLAAITLISFFVFGEKSKWWQWIGIGMGIVSILLLSL